MIPAEQHEMGISAQMIRLSIGVEDAQDLMADLEQAFQAVGMGKGMPKMELV